MKISKTLSFPKLENEFLENILRQLVNQHTIIQMFFTKQPSCMFAYLIIHIEKNTEAQQLQKNKWVQKFRNQFKIDIYFIYSEKLLHQFSLGHPFIKFYCQSSALIYQNKELGNPIINKQEWKKYKKRFKEFENHFYHDHDLHKSQIQNLILEGSSNSVFTTYARLLAYDLDYLEELYTGNKSALLSLDERINNLIAYIPDIQKFFVRKSHNKYYLTDLFIKAREATADDEVFYNDEMFESIGIAEKGLFNLIEERLEDLKKLIKKGFTERHEVSCQVDKKPKDEILSVPIAILFKSAEVEQIYLYHQITYGEKTTYYLMLIANGLGNEKLNSINMSLKSKIGQKNDFVLISHNRYWIQTYLYQHQSFFAKILQGKYLIYSSSKYHPDFHWEIPHKPYHTDLYFYYKPTKDIAHQFLTIVNNTKENYQCLGFIFALFFISFCRTYIYIKTYYLPNYLSNETLWQLCSYADADIRKYNYLIEQFSDGFFPYLNRHITLGHNLSKFNHEKIDEMKAIVEKLNSELHDLVIEGGLLDFEQE